MVFSVEETTGTDFWRRVSIQDRTDFNTTRMLYVAMANHRKLTTTLASVLPVCSRTMSRRIARLASTRSTWTPNLSSLRPQLGLSASQLKLATTSAPLTIISGLLLLNARTYHDPAIWHIERTTRPSRLRSKRLRPNVPTAMYTISPSVSPNARYDVVNGWERNSRNVTVILLS